MLPSDARTMLRHIGRLALFQRPLSKLASRAFALQGLAMTRTAAGSLNSASVYNIDRLA